MFYTLQSNLWSLLGESLNQKQKVWLWLDRKLDASGEFKDACAAVIHRTSVEERDILLEMSAQDYLAWIGNSASVTRSIALRGRG
jgi:hypothetical protein